MSYVLVVCKFVVAMLICCLLQEHNAHMRSTVTCIMLALLTVLDYSHSVVSVSYDVSSMVHWLLMFSDVFVYHTTEWFVFVKLYIVFMLFSLHCT